MKTISFKNLSGNLYLRHVLLWSFNPRPMYLCNKFTNGTYNLVSARALVQYEVEEPFIKSSVRVGV